MLARQWYCSVLLGQCQWVLEHPVDLYSVAKSMLDMMQHSTFHRININVVLFWGTVCPVQQPVSNWTEFQRQMCIRVAGNWAVIAPHVQKLLTGMHTQRETDTGRQTGTQVDSIQMHVRYWCAWVGTVPGVSIESAAIQTVPSSVSSELTYSSWF